MKGLFSIADDTQVMFSSGNVIFDGKSFAFSKIQTAVCAASNADRYYATTDLFQITFEKKVMTYLGNDVTEQFNQWKDSLDNQWGIPTVSQWKYLISKRTASVVSGVKNARFMKCTVRGTECLLLFPDEFAFPDNVELPPMQRINDKVGDFHKVKYDYLSMKSLENAGCILLPAINWEWDSYDLCMNRICHGHDLINAGNMTSGNYWALPDNKEDKQFHHFIFSSKHYQIGSYRSGLEYTAFIRMVKVE